jgi:hypothetical protein
LQHGSSSSSLSATSKHRPSSSSVPPCRAMLGISFRTLKPESGAVKPELRHRRSTPARARCQDRAQHQDRAIVGICAIARGVEGAVQRAADDPQV